MHVHTLQHVLRNSNKKCRREMYIILTKNSLFEDYFFMFCNIFLESELLTIFVEFMELPESVHSNKRLKAKLQFGFYDSKKSKMCFQILRKRSQQINIAYEIYKI